MKVADPSENEFCAKFKPNMTSTFAKNDFPVFHIFLVFGLFDL